ncbi:DJ-1 family glyoxalase III [Muribaculum intestinale]|uniref:DJ-1 family glyoxalase III n=1 Tax=Muribaculum intestinale TaxID=1796646 RepID=UPI0025A9FF75|nr:DJ-1 family glyoxalase III [Muribaculum intestinale]
MTETSIRIPTSSRPSGKATFVMLGNGFDEIEALAPVDVMRRAGMEVFTVSMTDNRLVKGATGNNIVADMGISDLNPEHIDWLIFPGADKSEDAVNLDESLNDIVKDHWDKGGNIAAICAAPALILGPLGIIKGVKATGYPFLKEDLEKNGGIYSDESVVIGDRMITSKGPGTTLEFALAIVRKAKGPETEKALREGMVIPKCG